MREISLKESKEIMLKALESIDKCCRENRIKYTLCWGTMIGAIRHHGFIPWDDDIDLAMPREDYNRFLNVYKDPNYGLYSPRHNKNCILIFTKVYDNKTCTYYSFLEKSLYGVWISIFPYDNAPDKNIKWWEVKRNFWMSMYHIKVSVYVKNEAILRRVAKFALKLPLMPFSSFWIYNKVEECLTQYNNLDTKNICIWPGESFTLFEYYPKSLFAESIDVDFDGVNSRIIKGYDQFLTMKYGDYMTFPPESERIPKHNYKAYFIE